MNVTIIETEFIQRRMTLLERDVAFAILNRLTYEEITETYNMSYRRVTNAATRAYKKLGMLGHPGNRQRPAFFRWAKAVSRSVS